jgi:glucose/arabinose dehydrogenase
VPGVGPLDFPVAVRTAFDGTGRLFIVERRGRIRVWHRGQLSTFLDIRDRVLSSTSGSDERGLLGLAFAPGFGVLARHFYVYYTTSVAPNEGDQVLARFFLGPSNLVADPASEREVLRLDDPFGNHNGGDLHFGPDGFLYIGLGDGGSGNDPNNSGQNPNDLWGKMLRLDTEAGAPETTTYAVPLGNPFVGVAGVRPEIWHLGLRNPWRWSFDRDTGDLWIGDVGQDAWEEINLAPPNTTALNFGWRRFEGSRLRPGEPTLSTDPNATAVTLGTLTPPVAETPHSSGDRSVTGGYVYRATEFPRMAGVYLYADYLSGNVYGLQPDGAGRAHRRLFEDPDLRISGFGEDEDGTLYATQLENGGQETGRLLKVVDVTDREYLRINDAARDPLSGRLRFTFGAIIGKFYQPEVSSDLVSWRPSGPVLPADDVRVPFTEPEDSEAGVAPRYFRVREL